MSKTIEVEVYKWEELSQSAQERARDWYIEGMDYEWWEGVYETVKEEGYKLGFCIDKINFSGFYSQGDGACWQGQVDVRQWLETHAKDSIGISAWCALIQENIVNKHIPVTTSPSNYCHENTMVFGDVDDDTDSFVDEYTMQLPSIFKGMTIANLFDIIDSDTECELKTVEAITKEIEASGKAYAKDIYHRLREEYEYLCSEEMMLDHFNCNDYYFDETGRLA